MSNSAPTYNLAKSFGGFSDDITTAPCAVVAVVRLALPISFDRSNMASVNADTNDGVDNRGKTLIINSTIKSLTISKSKSQHVKQMQVQMRQGDINYLTEIYDGDWVFAWITDGEDKANELIKRIKKGDFSNRYDNTENDGFKFVGRVNSVYKNMFMSPEGTKVTTYNLTATAFHELDTAIFYDTVLAESTQQAGGLPWLFKLGLDIRDFFTAKPGDPAVSDNVHKIIPQFFEIVLGKGVRDNLVNPGGGELTATHGSVVGGDVSFGPADPLDDSPKPAEFAYLVPEEVGKLLNKKSRAGRGILAYADVVELLVGIQQYNTSEKSDRHTLFQPTPRTQKGNLRIVGKENMIGAFLPNFPAIVNRPLWSLLQEYLNPVMNEMYTCFRVNDVGVVVPTVVLRQIPFTTPAFMQRDDANSAKLTPFHSLPRWVLPDVLVRRLSIGHSDATRVNFVHVYGQNAAHQGIPISQQIGQNKPISDRIDIQRSGFRPFMTTVAVDTVNQQGKVPTYMMQLVADRVMGSQFTLNGTIECFGITDPVAEGDNLEFGGVLYHIESVVDVFSISDGGERSFSTSFSLSNGVRVEEPSEEDGAIVPGIAKSSDYKLYSIVTEKDQMKYVGGISHDHGNLEGDSDLSEEDESDVDESGNKEPGNE